MLQKLLPTAILLVCSLAAAAASGQIREPDHTFYGTVTSNGALVTEGLVAVTVNGGGVPIASYPLGLLPQLGDRFVLRLPMTTGAVRPPGTARPGDEARIFVDGVLAGEATVGAPGEVQLLDLDPFFDDVPELSIEAAVEVAEGDTGSSDAVLVVRLSRAVPYDVFCDYATADGTATAPEDYAARSGRLTLAAGETRAELRIPVMGDVDPEPPEIFTVRLADPLQAVLADGATEAQVTIGADDAQAVVHVADAAVLEGDADTVDAVFTVTVRSEAPGSAKAASAVSIDYATVSGTALAGVDFADTAGTLVIDTATTCPELGLPCGQIRVPVFPDNQDEADETFTLALGQSAQAVLDRSEAIGTIWNDERFLVYVEAELGSDDGAGAGSGSRGGLGGVGAAAVSPDGAHLYAAGGLDHSLVTLSRDPSTGELTLGSAVTDGVGGIDGLAGVEAVATSPDGLHVYVAGTLDDALATFAREPVTGDLTFVGSVRDGVDGVHDLRGATAIAVSPDGVHVYAAAYDSDAVAVFEHDAFSGALSFADAAVDGLAGSDGVAFDGLVGVEALAFSPDGETLYAVSSVDSALVVLARDAGTGGLRFVEQHKDAVAGVDGLAGAAAVAVSPDGAHVYVAGTGDDAVAVFARDGVDGTLTFVERKRDGFGPIHGLRGVAAVAVAASGDLVFAASEIDNALVVFRRDPSTGRLQLVEVRRDGDPDRRGPLDGLAGAVGLAVSPEPDGRHVYVAGRLAHGLAVFAADAEPPTTPSISSPSHAPGTWSNRAAVELEWSSSDGDHGSGLAGYALVIDGKTATDPGIDLNRAHDPAADPQSLETAPGEGVHHVHLRACDLADQCSGTAHFGPLYIDTLPPTPAGGLASPSHDPGSLSNVSVIELTWSAATDAGSGLVGYSLRLDPNPAASCTSAVDVAADATSANLTAASGTWYVHLCAVDTAGNVSEAAVAGPYSIDATPPRVQSVETVTALPAGGLADGSRHELGFTQLIVSFTETVANAQDAARYRLVAAGADGRLQTIGCAETAGDDVAWPIADVAWDGERRAPALRLSGPGALPAGRYGFFACSSLVDRAGNRIDGDGNGDGGDRFALEFSVVADNLLTNPNFDRALDGWIADAGESSFAADPADADGRPTSGSARWLETSIPASVSALAQCVALDDVQSLELGGRVEIVTAAPAQPRVLASVELFTGGACDGTLLTSLFGEPRSGATAGWSELPTLTTRPAAGVRSGLVTYLVITDEPTTAEVGFDSLFLATVRPLFADGFEVGDTRRWSARRP